MLTEPIAYGRRTAKNRLVMAPMLTTTKEIGGFATPWHVEFYRSRAADGPGMVIVECTAVDAAGRNSPGELGLYKDEHIPAMARIAQAIRAGGALALVQIHDAGRASPASVNTNPRGVSPELINDGREVRAMQDVEIAGLAEAYGQAAKRALEAGFDGVELHGCHGYLINQFMSPTVNKRTDRWGGGAPAERAAFSRAVAESVRARTPADFILGYRMGFNDPDAGAGPAIAEALTQLPIDYLHVSGGIGPWAMPESTDGAHGYWLAAEAVRKVATVPVIAVNTIHTLALAEKVLADEYADAVAVARPYLLNADWMRAQTEGRALVQCLNCKGGCRYLRGGCPYAHEPQ